MSLSAQLQSPPGHPMPRGGRPVRHPAVQERQGRGGSPAPRTALQRVEASSAPRQVRQVRGGWSKFRSHAVALGEEGPGLGSWGGLGRRGGGGRDGLWSPAHAPGGVRGLPARGRTAVQTVDPGPPGPPGLRSQFCYLLAGGPQQVTQSLRASVSTSIKCGQR